jgi:hypothetical protein
MRIHRWSIVLALLALPIAAAGQVKKISVVTEGVF